MHPDRSVGDRTTTYLLIGCAVLAIGIPVLLAVANGGLTFPHNDAWSYSLIAQTFGQHGQFELVGWNRGALFGQVVPLGPLARSIVAQHVFVLLLGLGSLPLAYYLVSQRTNRAMGIATAATLAVCPGYALMSTSFMQDIPALFAGLGCLVLGERAIKGRNWLIAASMATGLWGVTIREQVIAAPVAVLLGLAWRSRRDRQQLVLLSGWLLALLAAFALFEIWRLGIPNGDPPSLHGLNFRDALARAFRGYITLGLMVSPLLLTALPRLIRDRRTVYSMVSITVLEVVFVVAVPSARRLIGGYLEPAGSYPAAFNGLREIVPGPLIWVLMGVGMLAGSVLPFVFAQGWRRLGPILLAYSGLLAAGTVVVIFTGQPVFDRYFLPFVPVVAVVCGPIDRRASGVRCAVGVIALGVCTLLLNLNALATDSALWRTAQSLTIAGLAPSDIDAGFNWYGYNATGPADQQRIKAAPTLPFYLTLFPESRGCVAVTVSPPTEGDVLRTQTYSKFGFFGSDELWVVDTGRCDLAAATLGRVASGSL